MKYLIITEEGESSIDEILFKHMRDVTEGRCRIVRSWGEGRGFAKLVLPTDWSTGELKWEGIK